MSQPDEKPYIDRHRASTCNHSPRGCDLRARSRHDRRTRYTREAAHGRWTVFTSLRHPISAGGRKFRVQALACLLNIHQLIRQKESVDGATSEPMFGPIHTHNTGGCPPLDRCPPVPIEEGLYHNGYILFGPAQHFFQFVVAFISYLRSPWWHISTKVYGGLFVPFV